MAEIWGAALAVAGSAYAANRQASAARRAGDAQAGAADRASQIDWDMYEQSRTDAEPWRQAGLTGLQEYMNLLGLSTTNLTQAISQSSGPKWDAGRAYLEANPDVARNTYFAENPYEHYIRYGISEGRTWQDKNPNAQTMQTGGNLPEQQSGATQNPQQAQQAAFDRFRAMPGYQFRLTEGQRALDSSASARGGLFSGKAGLDMLRYGQNYADAEGFTPYMNRLAALSGVGQTQTQANAQYGQAVAQNMGQNLMSGATARASGLIGAADARAQGVYGVLGGINRMGTNQGWWK